MDRPKFDSTNDTKWSGIMKKASPEILYISKQQGGLGFPDLTSVFKQSQLTRADILSTSVDPLANREPRKLAGTGWSAFQHRDRLIRLLSRRLKIGKPPRNTKEDVYWNKNWRGKKWRPGKTNYWTFLGLGVKLKPLSKDVLWKKLWRKMETNLDGQTPLSSYLDMKSNLVSTPYSTQQQHLSDWNNGELKITALENTWLTTSVRFARRERNPWIHSGTLGRGPGKNRKFIQPNRMETWQSFTDHKGESVGTFETNQNERISTMADLGTTSYRHYEIRFKAQTRHRSHQQIHQRHHYRRTYLSNGSAHDILAWNED